MSADPDSPTTTEIRLVYSDGRWTARDAESGATATGRTRSAALDALDAVIDRMDEEFGSIDPEDPFWTAEPVAAGGPTDISERVDEYLYGIPDEE